MGQCPCCEEPLGDGLFTPSASKPAEASRRAGSPCSMNTSGKTEMQHRQGNARNILGFRDGAACTGP